MIITIAASCLSWGSDSSLQISSSLRADNSSSECYLLQDEATLISYTCNPHPHKSIYGLISSISIVTTPLLSTSSSLSPDEWQSSAACRWKCHTNYLHFSHYHNPHDGLMRSHSVARGHLEVREVVFLTSMCIFFPLSLIKVELFISYLHFWIRWDVCCRTGCGILPAIFKRLICDDLSVKVLVSF